MIRSQKIGMLLPKEEKTDLVIMKKRLESFEVAPVIDKRSRLAEVPKQCCMLKEAAPGDRP